MASTNVLQKLLDKFGIKQQCLCDLAKVSKGTLSNIINNKNEPSIGVCLRIARALKMPVEQIFFDDELDDITTTNRTSAIIIDSSSEFGIIKDVLFDMTKKLDDLVINNYSNPKDSFLMPNFSSKYKTFTISVTVKSNRPVTVHDVVKIQSEDVYITGLNISEDTSKEFKVKSGRFKSNEMDVAEAI